MPTLSQALSQIKSKASSISNELGADAYMLYVTSSREPAGIFSGKVSPDVLPYMTEQLRKLGKKKKIVLLIHTNGGDIAAPWPIVSLLREYCTELNVVIVDRALSAGTLISMSADKIIMGPDAFLSPVDPQATIPINGQPKNVEVEDVTGYIEFVKNRAGLSGGAGLEKAFESLTNEIPPTVIGSLYRTHALIRSLASKILNTRAKKLDSSTEKQVIENLTEKLFSHSHLISRKEAKQQVGLGDTVVFAAGELLNKIYALSDELKKILKQSSNFNPENLLGQDAKYEEEIYNAILLTDQGVSAYQSKVQVIRVPDGNTAVNVNNIGWVKD